MSLIAEAISIASGPDPPNPVVKIFERGLMSALRNQAPRVLSYLLDHGASVNWVLPWMIGSNLEPEKPSLEVLEILVAHGWDINSRGPDCTDWPLLWRVTGYHDLVEWCLDHGASVYIPCDTPPTDAHGVSRVPHRPLLEVAAAAGTVATFELLRDKGAPLTRRTLHEAVKYATICAPSHQSVHDTLFERRMDMVRHIVDVLGIDVNAEEWWPGEVGGTPMCFVANFKASSKDTRKLIWFLLDHGADLNRAGSPGGGIEPRSALD